MMNQYYPLGLALLDFLPNIAFTIGAFFLVKIVGIAGNNLHCYIATFGALMIASGGILKAIWKLLYTLNIGDIRWMSEALFILQAPGFLLLFFTVIHIARGEGKNNSVQRLAFVPWKLPFLLIMTICSLSTQVILSYLSLKRKEKFAAGFFVLSFLGLLSMGGLANLEQSVKMQWISEIVNSIAQISFMIGTYLLYKNYK